jgi:hypothetical protein
MPGLLERALVTGRTKVFDIKTGKIVSKKMTKKR